MLDWVLIGVAVVTLWFYLTKKPENYPPGPPWVPILGSIPFVKFHNFHFELEKMKEKYGPVIGLKLSSLYSVAVVSPKEVEEVFRSEHFQGRPDVSTEFDEDLSKGIMFTHGPSWVEQKRFTLRHLRDFGFGKKTQEALLSQEMEEFFKTFFGDEKIVQVSGLFNMASVNVLWSIMGGERFSYDDANFKKLLSLLQRVFRSGNVGGASIYQLIPPLSRFFPEASGLNSTIALRKFLEDSITKHKANVPVEAQDFIDLYLKEIPDGDVSSSFTDNRLKSICSDLFSAGAESTGNSLGFCLLYLVLYPEWQDKIFEEVSGAIGSRMPSMDDRKNLPLVEAFMAEVFRSNTIAPLAVPHMTTADCKLGGYNIPSGAFVFVSIWSLLQDKEYWGDPENFRPERFITEEGTFKKDPRMATFGIGKRICLGESLARTAIFMFFTRMVQLYLFSLPAGHAKPSTICMSGFTTAPQPFEVKIKTRN